MPLEKLTLSDLPTLFVTPFGIAIGLLFGSFLNVVIHRLPREESVVFPGSKCPSCGSPIAARDNIPVLSWLLLRGRARCCGARVSARYPLVELMGGLLAAAVLQVLIYDLPPETPAWRAAALFCIYLALGLGLLAATFIDLQYMILPDSITIGGTVLGIVAAPLRNFALTDALLGAGFGFVLIFMPFIWLYARIRGHSGMGLGDAKLAMLAGAWFGWQGALFVLVAGAIQGTLLAIVVFIVRGRLDEPDAVQEEREQLQRHLQQLEGEEKQQLLREIEHDPLASAPESGFGKARMAFGPFLALATLEYLFVGPWMLDQYWQWVWLA